MAPHSSILAWRVPWTEEPGRLQSMGSLRVGHNLATKPPPPAMSYVYSFSVWLTSLRMILSRPIHVAANSIISLFFTSE